MAKSTTTDASGAAVANETKKDQTNWGALKNLAPVEIVCQAYPEFHRHVGDLSCHSKLRFDAEQIASHVAGAHGGGFKLKLKPSDKPVALWEKFAEKDFQAVDFRCEVCDAVLPFHANKIAPHMKAHAGKTRRLREGGLFNLTVRIGAAPVVPDDELFAENG